ncbi:hypothetical protein ACLOJK_024135, partial [Asimina triloba]
IFYRTIWVGSGFGDFSVASVGEDSLLMGRQFLWLAVKKMKGETPDLMAHFTAMIDAGLSDFCWTTCYPVLVG